MMRWVACEIIRASCATSHLLWSGSCALAASIVGRPQGGRAADFGDGGGSLLAAAREYISPSMILDTSGGNSSTGGGLVAAPGDGDGVSFTPLLPPRMPPKDQQ